MSTLKIASRSDMSSSIGTGFFFRFDDICGKNVDTIVTNRHMVDTFSQWTLCFRSQVNNAPIHIDVCENIWIIHPTLDLAILPMHKIYKIAAMNSLSIHTKFFTKAHIPPPEAVEQFSCIEEILMVGYPDALMDSCNSLPIARRGITATPIKYNFNGKPEFLIDASVYGGSSGSPVFIFNQNGFKQNGTFYADKQRIVLLGINRAVHLHTLCNTDELQMKIPNGLGYVIKSSCLWDFTEPLKEFMSSIHNHNLNTDK